MANTTVTVYTFKTGGTSTNASDGVSPQDVTATFSTDPISVSQSYEWSIVANKVGTNGDGKLIVEGSHDNAIWASVYSPNVDVEAGTGTALEWLLTSEVTTVFDTIFPYPFIRLSYVPNGTTAGTIDFTLALYHDA
ncbi:MAG: hypothetical protein KAJ19_16740 [Gammaproteobacteria bacterium]|nr:hypothetical protein [Gammaproteobacteria bacterium]